MNTREIPRDQWSSFCDDFSRRHHGEKVVVDVLDRERGSQREADRLPFVGISADEKAGENVISVMVGERPDDHQSHLVNNPEHLRVAEGQKPAIEIEARDGPKTLIQFGE